MTKGPTYIASLTKDRGRLKAINRVDDDGAIGSAELVEPVTPPLG